MGKIREDRKILRRMKIKPNKVWINVPFQPRLVDYDALDEKGVLKVEEEILQDAS